MKTKVRIGELIGEVRKLRPQDGDIIILYVDENRYNRDQTEKAAYEFRDTVDKLKANVVGLVFGTAFDLKCLRAEEAEKILRKVIERRKVKQQ